MQKINKCRICNANIVPVLNLGKIKPFTFGATLKPAELQLGGCTSCGLVQLTTEIDLDNAYRQYWYRSGLNPSMLSALKDIVEDIESRGILEDGDTVIDIGCNDGSLLSSYKKEVIKIGYDPAYNLKERAEENCDIFVNDYFKGSETKAKVITSIAMFYDLPDPMGFIDAVKHSLHPDGMWVIQLTDLLSMFKVNAFDNICFEHLEYYTLKVLWKMMEVSGLDIVDVSYNKVNGGSIRLMIGHQGKHKIQPAFYNALRDEREYFDKHNFSSFLNAVNIEIHLVEQHVKNLVKNGKTVHIMGASTKGITLCQIIFGDKLAEYISAAAEVNADKVGLDFLGVPIISEEDSIAMEPDAYLVLPWHFKDTIIKKHKKYKGEFIFPLPEFEIVKH